MHTNSESVQHHINSAEPFGQRGPKLQVTKFGKPYNNVSNVMTLLRAHPALQEKFRFNTFSSAAELCQPWAFSRSHPTKKFPRNLEDSDLVELQAFIQKKCGLKTVNLKAVQDAADAVARENAYHPIREWLDALRWDGKGRLDSWLTTYLDAAGELQYLQCVGKMFLTSMIARIYEPGCKVDHMIILEGAQGARKSSACKVLGDIYYSDGLPPDVSHKDASLHLRGHWLIEIPEMHVLWKTENSQLKAFVTRRVEKYRPSYGRLEVTEPRQCVFIGTTNKLTYLKDETGGRRFWPVSVGQVNLVLLQSDRDQLFAEAVAWFKQGGTWWPDAEFEAKYVRPQQADRWEEDAWEEPVRNYLMHLDRVKIINIAKSALHFTEDKVGQRDTRRIAAILEREQWVPKRFGPRGDRYWAPKMDAPVATDITDTPY